MPGVSTNPTYNAPAAQPGTEDPHNQLGPPPPPNPTGTYDAYQHPLTGIVAATLPREHGNTIQGALTSGTLYVMQFGCVAGTVISKATALTATTAKTGGTHGWYVIADSTLTVRAVTADQTDAATVWGAQSTYYPLSFVTPMIAQYTGAYYFGIMVANNAGTQPTFSGAPQITAGASDGTGLTNPLIFSASSGTGLTTPPAVGTAIAALTPVRNFLPYVFMQ